MFSLNAANRAPGTHLLCRSTSITALDQFIDRSMNPASLREQGDLQDDAVQIVQQEKASCQRNRDAQGNYDEEILEAVSYFNKNYSRDTWLTRCRSPGFAPGVNGQ
ncbi:MAG: hypothetical protein FWD79_02930 [Desulfobulbus sp.]|nr:hypothetical protein [Desulfobulbus sp.]